MFHASNDFLVIDANFRRNIKIVVWTMLFQFFIFLDVLLFEICVQCICRYRYVDMIWIHQIHRKTWGKKTISDTHSYMILIPKSKKRRSYNLRLSAWLNCRKIWIFMIFYVYFVAIFMPCCVGVAMGVYVLPLFFS